MMTVEPFRNETERGSVAIETGVETTRNACALTLPLRGDDDGISAWLNIVYATREPLTAQIAIRALSGGVAVERMVLRIDLARALTSPVHFADLTMGPSRTPGMVAFVFEEDASAIPVVVPQQILERFIAASRMLVPMDEQAEAVALTRALAMKNWR